MLICVMYKLIVMQNKSILYKNIHPSLILLRFRILKVLNTNKNYYEFQCQNFTFSLMTDQNSTNPDCEWQAFQGFAYKNLELMNMTIEISDLLKKNRIFPISSSMKVTNGFFVSNNVRQTVKTNFDIRYYFPSENDNLIIYPNIT